MFVPVVDKNQKPLLRNGRYGWSESETMILCKFYSSKTSNELILLFPDRTAKQIREKAKYLGLKKSKETISKSHSKPAWNLGLSKDSDKRVEKYANKLIGRRLPKQVTEKISHKLKGKTPWNKGVNKHNNELMKKVSEALTGIKRSQQTIERIKNNLPKRFGKYNSMYGRRGKSAPNYGGRLKGRQGYRHDLGHNVRSSWEANFARVFVKTGRSYKWEPMTFDLNGEGTYTPDFWDDKRKCWWEVKAVWTEKSKFKFELFRKLYPNNKIKVVDKKLYERLRKRFGDLIKWEASRKRDIIL